MANPDKPRDPEEQENSLENARQEANQGLERIFEKKDSIDLNQYFNEEDEKWIDWIVKLNDDSYEQFTSRIQEAFSDDRAEILTDLFDELREVEREQGELEEEILSSVSIELQELLDDLQDSGNEEVDYMKEIEDMEIWESLSYLWWEKWPEWTFAKIMLTIQLFLDEFGSVESNEEPKDVAEYNSDFLQTVNTFTKEDDNIEKSDIIEKLKGDQEAEDESLKDNEDNIQWIDLLSAIDNFQEQNENINESGWKLWPETIKELFGDRFEEDGDYEAKLSQIQSLQNVFDTDNLQNFLEENDHQISDPDWVFGKDTLEGLENFLDDAKDEDGKINNEKLEGLLSAVKSDYIDSDKLEDTQAIKQMIEEDDKIPDFFVNILGEDSEKNEEDSDLEEIDRTSGTGEKEKEAMEENKNSVELNYDEPFSYEYKGWLDDSHWRSQAMREAVQEAGYEDFEGRILGHPDYPGEMWQIIWEANWYRIEWIIVKDWTVFLYLPK